jgi:hypothetical protein
MVGAHLYRYSQYTNETTNFTIIKSIISLGKGSRFHSNRFLQLNKWLKDLKWTRCRGICSSKIEN